VEAAEEFIRGVMDLAPHENMRVRFLAGNRAAIGTHYFVFFPSDLALFLNSQKLLIFRT
jgi:hypothetical protein